MTAVTSDQLKLRFAKLAWQRDKALADKVSQETELAQVFARQALVPNIQAHLESIQSQAHAQTVGAYELILTQIVHEVLGDRWNVKLTPGYKNNQPSLDIDVVQNESVEDILEGNGGALTNVVCAGLRFAVLARSGKRRFLVLDEPDCWMKPSRVPAFFRALAAVCDQAGFQAIVVSHHPMDPADPEALDGAEALPDTVSFARLKQAPNGTVVAECEIGSPVKDGLVSLRAVNLRTHTDTTVQLGAGLTLLTGDNNLGKSALISGLRALVRGGASDTHIRHKEDSLRFEVELRKEDATHVVAMTRGRKGNPRVTLTHRYKGAETYLHEERGSQHSVPEWLGELLDMAEIEGLDPQLISQKTPVFLLEQSASVRAKLLYAGREAAILAKMFALHKQNTREDKDRAARLSATLASLANQVDATVGLPPLGAAVSLLGETEKRLNTAHIQQKSLEALIPRLTRVMHQGSLVAPVVSLTPPTLYDGAGLQRLAKQISRLMRQVALSQPIPLPEAPVLQNAADIRKMGVRLSRLGAVEQLPALPQLPVAPTPFDLSRLADHIRAQAKQDGALAALEAEQARLTQQITDEHRRIEELVQELGGVCPVCHQQMSKENVL